MNTFTTSESQLSPQNAGAISAALNVAYSTGREVLVNGERLIAKADSPAVTRHANGSLSFRTASNPSKRTYVKVGHMVTVSEEAPADSTPEAPVASMEETKNGKRIVVASVKGETGYLSTRRVEGKITYAVTMDVKKASPFTPGDSLDRHIARAQAGGIQFPGWTADASNIAA